MKQKDYTGAERSFQQAFDMSNGATDAGGALIDAKLAAGKVKEARTFADQWVAKNPGRSQVNMYAARVYRAAGDNKKAEEALQHALTANPSDLQAYFALITMYLEEKRMDEARAQLQKIIDKQPKAVWAHTLIAMSHHLQGHKTEAQAEYEKVLAIDPQAVVASNNLAMMLLDQGKDLNRALELAKTAKRQMPDSPEACDTLGLAFMKNSQPASAIPQFSLSISKDPNNPVYHGHLGVAYAQAGQKDKARASLQRALSLGSNFDGSDEARRTLADISK
jgi:tetratricopeptide (TPR) repeat protein